MLARRINGKNTRRKHYTVYDNRTDEPICIAGTAEQCAVAMGVKPENFKNILCRYKKRKRAKKKPKWEKWAFIEEGSWRDCSLNILKK